MEIINPPSSVTPPSEPDMSDTSRSAKRADRKRLFIIGSIVAVVVALGAGGYSQFIQGKVGAGLRFRILGPQAVTAGQRATITWDLSPENQLRYPTEKIEYCTGTSSRTCRVLSLYAPNDGQEVVTIPANIEAGTGYIKLTARDSQGILLGGYATRHSVRVAAFSPVDEDNGGGGGGGGSSSSNSGGGNSGTGTTVTTSTTTTATVSPTPVSPVSVAVVSPASPLLPDLAAQNLTVSKTNVVVGEVVTFTGSVKNKGGGRAAASRAAFCLDNSNNNCKNTFDGRLPGYGHDVPALEAGAHAGIFTDTWTATTPGIHTIKVCADVNNDVTEGVETEEDNCASLSVPVIAVSPTSSPAVSVPPAPYDVTQDVPPGAFSLMAPVFSTNDNSFLVNWSASSGATGYDVIWAHDGACANRIMDVQRITTTSATAFMDAFQQDVYLCVNAVNGSGTSTPATGNPAFLEYTAPTVAPSVAPSVSASIVPSYLPILNNALFPAIGSIFSAGAQINVSFSYDLSAHDSFTCGEWYLDDRRLTGNDWVGDQLPDPSHGTCN